MKQNTHHEIRQCTITSSTVPHARHHSRFMRRMSVVVGNVLVKSSTFTRYFRIDATPELIGCTERRRG